MAGVPVWTETDRDHWALALESQRPGLLSVLTCRVALPERIYIV